MTELSLTSGYTVQIKGKGPFAFDHINRRYPDLPDVNRVIVLATGEEAEWPYEPPETPPDPDDQEEYALYARWRTREAHNERAQAERRLAYVRFAKQHCVWIASGPLSFWDRVVCGLRWGLYRLGVQTGRLPFKDRYLWLLDTDVIQTVDDWNKIEQSMLVPEVTVDSVLDVATRYFRGNVGRASPNAASVGGTTTDRATVDQHAGVGDASGAIGGQDARAVV